MWVDTHCHIFLTVEGSPSPREALDRAAKAGVTRAVVVGIDPESSRTALEIAQDDDRCVATVGLHPNEAHRFDRGLARVLEELAGHPLAAAVGETGIDLYRKGANPNDQERAFRFQLQLGRLLGKPVVVHVRDAHAEVQRVLFDEAESRGLPLLVMHCFSGSERDAETYLSLGAYLSFAGPITFRTANARPLRKLVEAVPIERCLVETDSPFLSPHPYRGKPNEPARAAVVGKELALLKGVAESEVATVTTASATRIFWNSLDDTRSGERRTEDSVGMGELPSSGGGQTDPGGPSRIT